MNTTAMKVIIRSSQLWARAHCHDMFSASHEETSYYDSQAYLRKARHQWGWDNAPRLITSGIYRCVYLESLPPERFEEVYLYTEAIGASGISLGADWIYRTEGKCLLGKKLRLTLMDAGKPVYEDTKDVRFIQGSVHYTVPKEAVKLWWPRGFGEPHLYTVRLEMLSGGNVLADYEAPFGIRTLTLDRTGNVTADGIGEFIFRINGEKVFIRGTNWKPLDPLGSLADQKTRECRALQEILNLNCNMVRIWGGGIYEDPAFFDFCDRNGLMVWQDFMLACEIPPTDEAYSQLVAQEAAQIIKKYRNHPSLAIWCGDNENDECMTWIRQHAQMLPSESILSRETLKRAVLRFDPYRGYVESSPYASDQNFTQRIGTVSHFQPETHLYPEIHRFAQALRSCKSFFIGEVGPLPLNAIAVNERTYARERQRAERLWDAPPKRSTNVHQNDDYFATWRNEGKQACLHYFGQDFRFTQWKDYTLAINLLCAEMFKDVIEYCRVTRWSKTGVIWWSLMDMWPMLFNYSVIDYEYNKKLPYFWIRQSQQNFALMGVRTELDGELALYAANDTRTTRTVQYTVTAYSENGSARIIASGICRQEGNSAALIQRIAESDAPELWVIQWTENGVACFNHVFTQKASFETMREWVKIIGQQQGFAGEILEIAP